MARWARPAGLVPDWVWERRVSDPAVMAWYWRATIAAKGEYLTLLLSGERDHVG